ncbi:hypothetical protein [Gordonia insulae]|uniref:Uncharacterized protein n=1 Tax=Gordonia insulae TaxID=2420509 RepID=A0A3G8JHT2_9ACTN|nr:hypothetical protein [Gordonia insulae]AZG44584.1 hypothetical protein D7316_01170 [Gordonia insulae]
MTGIGPDQAHEALRAAEDARRRVADELGLPRAYWWGMAAGWLVLGAIGELGFVWLTSLATLAFGAGHSYVAARLLDGRRRTPGVRVSREVAGRRIPFVVIGMLLGMVAVTIGLAFAIDADGADHPAIWAAVIVACVVGLGGPEIFRTLCRWVGV